VATSAYVSFLNEKEGDERIRDAYRAGYDRLASRQGALRRHPLQMPVSANSVAFRRM
jgi:hypothetical protein